jgi:hypothetical protein
MAKEPIDRYPSAGDLGRAAIASTRGVAVTEPEHVVASGEAAPLPETVRLSRDPFVPPTHVQPRRRGPSRMLAFILALLAIAALAAAVAIEAPKLSRSHATAESSGTGASSSPSELTVPSLVGQPLDVAERNLDDLGLGYTEEGDTGLFGVLVPSDWEVCDTDPGVGTAVPPGSTVRLLIARPGSC